MSEAGPAIAPASQPGQGLVARLFGVVFSPYAAYADVAARPRLLGAMLFVVVVSTASSAAFSSSQRGREMTLDQAIQAMESFGMQISDEMYAQIENGIVNQPVYRHAIGQAAFWPVGIVALGGILWVVFNALLGYSSTFKHVTAVVAYSCVLMALQLLFVYPMFYLKESMASPTSITVFMPFLEEGSLPSRLLGTLDLFRIWWVANLAIGLAVLYRKRVQPILAAMMAVYLVIALSVASVGALLSRT